MRGSWCFDLKNNCDLIKKMAQVLTAEPELSPAGIRLVNEGSTTLAEIMGDDIPDMEDPLELLSSPVKVKVYKSEDSIFYSVLFLNSYFSQKRFNLLLTNATSEQKQFQGSVSILADWIMPDRASLMEREFNLEKLMSLHESFGKPWFEFETEHRKRFMVALDNEYTQRILSILEQQSKVFITKGKAIEEIKDLVQQANITNVPYLLSKNGLIGAGYRYTMGRRLTGNKLRAMSAEKKDEIMKEVNQYPDNFLYTLLERGALPQYNFFVDEDNPENIFYERNPISKSVNYSFDYLGQGHYKITYMGSWIEMELKDGNFRKIDSDLDFNYKTLSPWIVWSISLDTGERIYLNTGIPAEIFSGGSIQADSLLGLIVVANVSPEQRKKLPVFLMNRRMEEAQIPVQLSMEPYRGDMLEGSPLFRNTEARYTL